MFYFIHPNPLSKPDNRPPDEIQNRVPPGRFFSCPPHYNNYYLYCYYYQQLILSRESVRLTACISNQFYFFFILQKLVPSREREEVTFLARKFKFRFCQTNLFLLFLIFKKSDYHSLSCLIYFVKDCLSLKCF